MRLVVAAVALVAVMASAVTAHNWLGSPSRAKNAAVTKPCQMRVDQQPHVQVTAGQEFTMEWTVGHGDYNQKWMYFISLHEKDYDKLNDITTDQMDEYIRSAPTSAYLYNATKWKKTHINKGGSSPDAPWNSKYGSTTPITAASDADFIARDYVMSSRKNVYWDVDQQTNQYRFYPQYTQDDLRVAYASTKYPWIESAHRFRNSFAEHDPYAHEFDLARFNVPARSGNGNYIYFFYWGGYRDCVDVNVYPATTAAPVVARPYGVLNKTAVKTWVKIDHCSFYYQQGYVSPCQVVPASTMSASAVLKDCINYWWCEGAQAVRAYNPAGTLAFKPQFPNQLWDESQFDHSVFPPVVTGPCGSPDLNTRNNMGCSSVNPTCDISKLNPGADDYIVYGLMPWRDQDFQTIDDYIITNDANDPRYYSTCWVRVANTGFLEVPVVPRPTSKWDAGDKCVDCAFRTAAQKSNNDIVPRWADGIRTGSNCINCDAPTY